MRGRLKGERKAQQGRRKRELREDSGTKMEDEAMEDIVQDLQLSSDAETD